MFATSLIETSSFWSRLFDMLSTQKWRAPNWVNLCLLVIMVSFLTYFSIEVTHIGSYSETVMGAQRNQIVELQLYSALQEAEAGQRGYLLTKDSQYLERYYQGRDQAKMNLDLVGQLVANADRDEVARLKAQTNAKLEEMELTIRLATHDKTREALSLVLSDLGEKNMLAVRDSLAHLRNRERARQSRTIFGR
jgi:CHASE3 domain sensor protein